MSKPIAHVINLARRPERWQRTQELWSPWLELVRFPAIDVPDNGALGCKKSHYQLASTLLTELQAEEIAVILEDDNLPSEWMWKIGSRCIEEAKQHVAEWDFVNCSPLLDLTPIHMPCATLSPTVSPLFLRASYAHQTNFMIYNRRSLPLLKASLNSNLPIDMWIARHAECLWVPVRLLSTQDDSASDIRAPFPGQSTWYDLTRKQLETMR